MTNKYAYSGIHIDSKVTLDESGGVVYPHLGKKEMNSESPNTRITADQIIDPSHVS